MQNAFQKPSDSYLGYRETIQEVLYRILAKAGFSIGARLFSLLCFANAAGSFLYPGSREFSEEKLAREVDKVANNIYETTWHQEFENHQGNLSLPMSMIQCMLVGNFRAMDPQLKGLLENAWRCYANASDDGELFKLRYSDGKTTAQCSAMAEAYRQWRDRVNQSFEKEIEAFIENYAAHVVFSESYTDENSLFVYIQHLVLRVALLRFCLYSHPRILELVEAFEKKTDRPEHVPADWSEAVSGAVTEVMKAFSIGMTSGESPLLGLRQEMEDQQMADLRYMLLFVLF